MNIFIILNLIISVISISIKPKFCVNCKYFLSGGNNQKYGKCVLFTKSAHTNYYLVTGDEEFESSYYEYCATVRTEKDMCGEEAKLYKRKSTNKNNIKL